jgi:molybdopterin-guanine dinucleotide biosynthesis protein A
MSSYDTVILAGGVNSGDLRKYAPYENEALIIIGNYPMIHYVHRALQGTKRINDIVISGPCESLRAIFKKEDNLVFVNSGEDAIESFANALPLIKTEKILVMPADIPFITPEAIEDFLNRCEEHDADIYYSIVPREVNEARFPRVKRTYVKLKEGVFTGGNLFLIRTKAAPLGIQMGKKLVANRKQPIAQARLFGLDLVLKYISGRLSIPEVEERFSKTLDLKGKAIISRYAEVGVDVDKPSDLKLAEQVLGKGRK